MAKIDNNNLDLSALNNLSPAERELALQILEEYSKTGSSEEYNKLLLEDYQEIPVTIDVFLDDDDYLGKGLHNVDEVTGVRKQTVFPYWRNVLHKLFPTNIDTAYNTLILSGAIGLGKSFIAVIAMLYMLYRMLCLKDPYKHYGLQPIDHITFSIMNITLDAAKGVAWSKIQELLQMSPWFMDHGRISKSLNPVWQPNENIELIFGSQPRHVIGRALFCSFEDEISFQPNSNIEIQKKKARELVSSIDARMSSRFMHGEKLPTLHILASSKRTDQSFLETYIDTKRKNESKTTLIIDEPQWVIRTDKDSPNKFAVAVGNKFLDSEVLPLSATEQDYQIYRDKGYQILMVPMGYHEQFVDDINIALTDIAGISTSNSMNYINGVRWTRCRNDKIKNPFMREILEIGNGPEDIAQYYDFFDLSLIPPELKAKPLFIHLDMSLSGDKTGIAGVFIKGKKPKIEGQPESKELFYRVGFSVSIKAPKGRQISFEKNRQFIYWLKEKGFKIKGISYDTYNSADLGQSLASQGFNCKVISVDRTTPIPGSDTHMQVCLPYQTFRNAIYEERVEIYPTNLLTAEIVGLVRNSNGKIDHTPAGINSKDQADALCLSPDTRIFLLSGQLKTIKEMYENQEQEYWVLAYNTETFKLEPVKVSTVLNNGYKDNLITLYLDNGKTLTCTEDHLLLDRDGNYIQAKDSLNISLMPFEYTQKVMYANRDYPVVYNPNSDYSSTAIYLHKLVAENVLAEVKAEKERCKQPDEWIVIHHMDCDRFNNNPNNLEYLTNREHSNKHVALNSSTKKREQLRTINKERIRQGTHPFSKLTREQLQEQGRNSRLKMNKSEKHRLAISKSNAARVAAGTHNFQTNAYKAHTPEANRKREETCMRRYGGKGFKSAIIQAKCREGCLKKHGYDNPFRSSQKQEEMRQSRERKHLEKIYSYLGINNTDPISFFDIKCVAYSLNISLISDIAYLNALGYNIIDASGRDLEKYIELRDKCSCIRKFLKDTGKEEFTYSEFSDYYEDQCARSGPGANTFKSRFRNKPTYEDILALNFKIYNHRVIRIEKAAGSDVYDLKLDKIHNFALDCGIFVHNCGSIYHASQYAEEFAYDYGEQAEELLRINSDSEEYNQQQLTLNLKEDLKRLAPKMLEQSVTNPYAPTENYTMYDDIIIL